MKKLYTLSLVLFASVAFAQTFYSESFGTTAVASPYPSATDYTGYQNSAPIVYTGTADVRGTAVSAGYAGASGGNNVFITNVLGKYLQIDGLDTSAYASADIQLAFGLNSPSSSQPIVEQSTDGSNWTALTYTVSAAGWKLITIGGGSIPSSATLSLRFSQPDPIAAQFRVDDIKLSSVSATCALAFGNPTTACDSNTAGNDTYTATIPFTGGGTATYGITASAGTNTGDNPSTTAAGNIIISGIPEGQAITIGATGGTCNLSLNITASNCDAINALPWAESFNYTDGTALSATQFWTGINSGDDVLVAPGNLNYSGITSTGSSISFSGSGAEAYANTEAVTSGMIYASFLLSVTDYSNVTNDGTETYFAAMHGTAATDYRGRIYVKKSGEQYLLGASNLSTGAVYGANLYNVGDVVLVVERYDFDTNTLSYWFNPDAPTFNESTAADLTEVPATAITNISGFAFRQDDDLKTPSIKIDELRMSTSSPLAVAQNQIDGLKVYPNPVTNGTLFINTAANGEKAVTVYDVLGKQVLNTKTSTNTVNVSNLKGGVYIVKITEGGKTATRKMVIK